MNTDSGLKLANMAPTLLHINQELEIVLVHEGSVRVSLGYCDFELTGGQFTLIPPYRLHGFEPQPGTDSVVYLFSTGSCADITNMYINKELQNHVFELTDITYSYIKNITADYIEQPDSLLCNAVLYAFLSVFTKNSSFTNMSVDISGVNRIVEYIFLNLHNDINAKSVAAEFSVSDGRLSEMLMRYVGLGFKDLLTSMRISRSMEILRKKELSITEVAFESGFESLRTFNRCFLRVARCTPSEYRKQLKK